MLNHNTDKEWEIFGKDDPYFGVLTDNKFRKSNLTDKNKQEFFKSGYIYIDDVLKKIRHHVDSNFMIRQALDFGCGVGRLVIPLASIADKVTGIDVSDSMLSEARKNCETLSIKNVIFIKSDDRLSLLKGNKYNFIHSFIVFQHIPVKRGEHIFENLLTHLEDGGICVIHVTYAKAHAIQKVTTFVKKYIPLSKNIINLIKGEKFFTPHMQLNDYNLNKLLFIMWKFSVYEFYAEHTNHEGHLGITLYFKKPVV